MINKAKTKKKNLERNNAIFMSKVQRFLPPCLAN